MSKQKISAEEKHYIKLNNQLHKQIKQLKLTNSRLVFENEQLKQLNDSYISKVEQQQDWIERLCDCVKMTPEAFKLWTEAICKQAELETVKQEHLKCVLDFIKNSSGLFNL